MKYFKGNRSISDQNEKYSYKDYIVTNKKNILAAPVFHIYFMPFQERRIQDAHADLPF